MKSKIPARWLLLVTFSLINSLAYSQTITISGPSSSSPGVQETYTASFDYSLNPYTTLTWTVSGGTIISQVINPTAQSIYCVVEWGITSSGNLSLYDDVQSVTGEIPVDICGEADCSPPVTLCAGECAVIGVTPQPNCTYLWSPTTGLNDPTIAQPTACPTTTTTYTVTMTPQNGCPATQCPVTVTINQKPTISPSGPIVKCVHYETQNWLILNTNLTGNLEWYENGNLISGQTNSTLILANNPSNGSGWPNCTGTITVKNTITGCLSEGVVVTRKNFTSPQVYFNEGQYDTPTDYCKSLGGNILQAPSLNPGTTYWWEVLDPNGNAATGISISPMYTTNPNSSISFSSNYSYSTATIIAKAIDNGCEGATDGSWNQQYTIDINPCRIGMSSFIPNESTSQILHGNRDITVFPNPANDHIRFTSKEQILQIQIIQLNGKIISTYYPKNQVNFYLNTSSYPAGIYNCKVLTNKGPHIQKLIIQR